MVSGVLIGAGGAGQKGVKNDQHQTFSLKLNGLDLKGADAGGAEEMKTFSTGPVWTVGGWRSAVFSFSITFFSRSSAQSAPAARQPLSSKG